MPCDEHPAPGRCRKQDVHQAKNTTKEGIQARGQRPGSYLVHDKAGKTSSADEVREVFVVVGVGSVVDNLLLSLSWLLSMSLSWLSAMSWSSSLSS
eukprot:2135217-Amphidinium_carterae.1